MFHSSSIFVLSLHIFTHLHLASASKDEFHAHEIDHYLLDTFRQYQDHEVFSVEVGREEDIIYITKREPLSDTKDCSDCDYFTPWGESDKSSLLGRSASTSQVDGVNETIPLVRRAGKKKKNIKHVQKDKIKFEFFLFIGRIKIFHF